MYQLSCWYTIYWEIMVYLDISEGEYHQSIGSRYNRTHKTQLVYQVLSYKWSLNISLKDSQLRTTKKSLGFRKLYIFMQAIMLLSNFTLHKDYTGIQCWNITRKISRKVLLSIITYHLSYLNFKAIFSATLSQSLYCKHSSFLVTIL